MSLLIKNGLVIDPANKIEAEMDVLIENGTVKEVKKNIQAEAKKTIDAKGLWVCPGFIDLHVHLREPGREDKETIETCSRAAARGGFSTIIGMPNTTPIADDQTAIAYVNEKARKAIVNVHATGAMTKKSKSESLAQIGDLIAAGAIAISDDGWEIKDTALMQRAFRYLQMWDVPYISHSEDSVLADGGVMHEGKVSTELGFAGKPAAAEALGIIREILIAEDTTAHIHFTHVSTAQGARAIKEAKSRKQNVTADTCPHFIALTDEAVKEHGANAKMSPPLRSEDHRQEIIKALKNGTIDTISSDHAPHLPVEKYVEFSNCADGIVGLETSIPVTMTELYHKKVLSPTQYVEKFTINPATILRLSKGTLSVGADADITLIDPNKEETIDSDAFESKGRNTPFHGYTAKGIPSHTIVAGKIVMSDRKIN